jgi:riboflavin kinase / FMN adenylyltransferase
MKIYTQLADLPTDPTPVVATIGNFDGVHLGHQGVIAEVISRARFLGGRSLAITFDPPPARILRPDHPHPLITPLPRKLELLAATGIDATLVLPFTDQLRRMTPRTFASEILAQAIRATEIHEGENFRFGYQAEAGISGPTGLETLGRELGFNVVVYAPRIVRGAPVSSSRIRNLIAASSPNTEPTNKTALSEARALLGRPFSIDSTPAPGRGYGTRYTVPTINLAPYAELLPTNGVYITTLTIGPALSNASRHPAGSASRYPKASALGLSAQLKESGLQPLGHTFEAVTNIGTRPTFGADSFAIESHLLNFHPLEGNQALTETTPLRLTFLRRLRDEQKFPTTEALRNQIARDVTQARRYFTLCRTLA